MFTGIVQFVGEVVETRDRPPGKRLRVRCRELAREASIGESIALAGCCLSVIEIDGDSLGFDAGPETLAKTTLGLLRPTDPINLEPSLRVGDKLGGHFVTGHVDGVATLDSRFDENDWSTFWFRVDRALTVEMAPKGSVAVDGVSLTLVEVEAERFSVALIPHTLAVTTLGRLAGGGRANVETDILAKYVQKAAAIDRHERWA